MTHQADDGAERIAFELDEHLIDHLIRDQSSTVERALLELVMNSIDAGASTVTLDINDKGFVLIDNGTGFVSREYIKAFFARFGTQHQAGDAVYGRYRIGRAQIMGHASTEWRSRSFLMVIDPRSDNRGFALHDGLDDVGGCTINGRWLSETPHDPEEIAQGLIRSLAFPPATVVVNGHSIASASSMVWSHEDEFAYYLGDQYKPLRVYNQGIFVREFPSRQFHVGGSVVSKKALALNMSRNEIRFDCPVWRGIIAGLSVLADKVNLDSSAIGTDAYRAYMMSRILAGDGDIDAPVVTMIPKRVVSVRDWVSSLHHVRQISFSEYGETTLAEKLQRCNQVRIMHHDFTNLVDQAFGQRFSNQSKVHRQLIFLRQLHDSLSASHPELTPILAYIQLVPLNELENTEDQGKEIPWDSLDAQTQNALTCLTDSIGKAFFYLFHNGTIDRRNIHLGRSKHADAWTDGHLNIWLSHTTFKKWLKSGEAGLHTMIMVILHEYCHLEDSMNAGHDDDFYVRFHELVLRNGSAISHAMDLFRTQMATSQLGFMETGIWLQPAADPRISPPDEGFKQSISGVLSLMDDLESGDASFDDVYEALTDIEFDLDVNLEDGFDPVADRVSLPASTRFLFAQYPPDRLPQPGFLKELSLSCGDIMLEWHNPTREPYIHVASNGVDWCRRHENPKKSRLLTVRLLKSCFRTELAHGVPEEVVGSLRLDISRREAFFPWKERQFERDLVWWMMIRGLGTWVLDFTQGTGNYIVHIDRKIGPRRFIIEHDFGRTGITSIPTDEMTTVSPDEWLTKLDEESSRDLKHAIDTEDPGYFWRRWV